VLYREGRVVKGGESCIGRGVFTGSGVFYREGIVVYGGECCIWRGLLYTEWCVV